MHSNPAPVGDCLHDAPEVLVVWELLGEGAALAAGAAGLYEDEVWWSRLACPALQASQGDTHPLRRIERWTRAAEIV